MRLKADQTRSIVTVLGIAQTISWASTYYLPAILANPMARDLAVSPVMVFAAFSLAMIVSAIVGPFSGRYIDSHGGRAMLLASNIIFVAGLVLLSMVQEPVMLFVSWTVIGIGMGTGLYEAAFSTLAGYYGKAARAPITGITLIAGFASTVGWPLSALMETHWGWREACLGWAAIQLLVALPLNFLLPSGRNAAYSSSEPMLGIDIAKASSAPRHVVPLLAFVFAAGWFCSTSMASHLPRLLEAAGATTAAVVFAGSLIGPAQVVARMVEFRFLKQYHPLISARLATLMHPLGAALLVLFGGPAASVFTLLHGTGNGIMTIAKGTLPLALFGPANYGHLQGLISAPGRVIQAFAPLIFGYALETMGLHAIWLTAGVSFLAFFALMMLKRSLRQP